MHQKPIATPAPTASRAGIITQARAKRLLEDAMPQLEQLAPEAWRRGAAVAFFVTDPTAQAADDADLDTETLADLAELREYAGSKPPVAVLTVEVIASMLSHLADEPHIAHIIERLSWSRAPGSVPVVYTFGAAFGIIDLERQGSAALAQA